MNLTKEDTEKATYRNKMKEIENEAKLLKERLHKIWDLEQTIKLIKLEKVLEERRRQQNKHNQVYQKPGETRSNTRSTNEGKGKQTPNILDKKDVVESVKQEMDVASMLKIKYKVQSTKLKMTKLKGIHLD